MDPKESCCTALCFLCNPGSSLHSSSLRPPRKCGGLSKLVQSSSEWPADLWSLLLWLLLCLPLAGGLEVEMAGKTQMVFLHEDVTIPCKIPGSPKLDLNTVGVIWSLKKDRDESEVQVFEFYGDQREAVRPGADVSLLGLEHGNASLHLPRIELWEAGEYRCKVVVTPEKAEGTTRLEVVAHPDMCLFEKLATARNGKEKLIICQLEGFYPEAFDIKWMRARICDDVCYHHWLLYCTVFSDSVWPLEMEKTSNTHYRACVGFRERISILLGLHPSWFLYLSKMSPWRLLEFYWWQHPV
ncbi:natural cytotoxicity triggering receptor 3 ligand 1-like isoform X7 [Apodemus sylvaticus]|uniref:natural cytotoxicity triggering receptor 3 ligand 1-like isoform X7 n=1 Tax=Apodemus sylvaticus TaxID=10129 RepID=UPI002241FB12|nr:natural cytotoxicity triggering receptor 3 ligand 1-like isoform X7 [Apodemus sylvaticus]